MKDLIISRFDLEIILMHLENQTPLFDRYIDLDSGWVVSEESDDLLGDDLEANPDRYFPIDPYPSSEGFRIMESFIPKSGAEEQVVDRMYGALSGKKPFRKFRDVLEEFPELLRKFDDYKSQHLIEYLKDSLEELGHRLVVSETEPPEIGLK